MVFITNWGERSSNYFLHFIDMENYHRWLSGHEFEQALGHGEGQGGLLYCSPWGHKESDTTEQLNKQTNKYTHIYVYICIHIWASLVAQMVKICLQCWTPGFDPWVRKIPWRREWLPIPVLLPGEFHRQRSLAGYRPRGRKELDMAERLTLSHTYRDRKNSYTLLPFKENQQCDACFSTKFSIYFFQCNWYLFIFSCLSFLALYGVCILDLSSVLQ